MFAYTVPTVSIDLKISDMDEWMDSSDEQSSEDEENKEDAEEKQEKKKKAKKSMVLLSL